MALDKPLEDMSALQDQLDELNAQITKQGALVRQLKKDGGGADEISGAVDKLQALKIQATEVSSKVEADSPKFNRKAFDDLVLRKMFVVPSFEIHGGVKGLFDLGPPGCSLKVRPSFYEKSCVLLTWENSYLTFKIHGIFRLQ